MAFFEYRYRFSVDEEIIERYSCSRPDRFGPVVFETRIHFTVRRISGERKRIDWESFLTGCPPAFTGETENILRRRIGGRLKDCWMPNPQIRTMIEQLVVFAKQTGRPHSLVPVPVAVDVEVCTAQREGEEMAAAVERAMKPAHLPPLRFYKTEGIGRPVLRARRGYRKYNVVYLRAMPTVRVEDAEKASSVMDQCGVCGRKPIVGTQIITLLCGHAFHLHCVAEPLLEETNSCPTCNHQPAFNENLYFKDYQKYDHADFDPANPDANLDKDLEFVENNFNFTFWEHSPSTDETFWSQLLDDDMDMIMNDCATPHQTAAAAATATGRFR